MFNHRSSIAATGILEPNPHHIARIQVQGGGGLGEVPLGNGVPLDS